MQGLVGTVTPVIAGDDLIGHVLIRLRDFTKRKEAIRYPDGNMDAAHFVGRMVLYVCVYVCMYVHNVHSHGCSSFRRRMVLYVCVCVCMYAHNVHYPDGNMDAAGVVCMYVCMYAHYVRYPDGNMDAAHFMGRMTMLVCVCVCVCVWARARIHVWVGGVYIACMYVHRCALCTWKYLYVCVDVRVRVYKYRHAYVYDGMV